MSKQSIVWIASYPKSGSTWLRSFLANLVADGEAPLSASQIYKLGNGDAVLSHYLRVGDKKDFDPANQQQSLSRRRILIERIHRNQRDVSLVKTHCLNRKVHGFTLIEPSVTKAALYIVRDPRDLVLSFAAYFEISVDEAIEIMATDNYCLPYSPFTATQFLGSWKQHVESWTQASSRFPRIIIRYEDLLANPRLCFQHISSMLGLPLEVKRLNRALAHSRFQVLQKDEAEKGFNEFPNRKPGSRFFRKGQAGEWREGLSEAQVERILSINGPLMDRLGYET